MDGVDLGWLATSGSSMFLFFTPLWLEARCEWQHRDFFTAGRSYRVPVFLTALLSAKSPHFDVARIEKIAVIE
jgi:hypothetical protein